MSDKEKPGWWTPTGPSREWTPVPTAEAVEWPIDDVENSTHLLLGHFKRKFNDIVEVEALRNVEDESKLVLHMNNGDKLCWIASVNYTGMFTQRPLLTLGPKVPVGPNEKLRRKLAVDNKKLMSDPKERAKLFLMPDE